MTERKKSITGTKKASGKPPQYAVGYQQQDGGSWHTCMIWGSLCSPTAERSTGGHRINHLNYAVSPEQALLHVTAMYPDLGAEAYVMWPWDGKATPIGKVPT